MPKRMDFQTWSATTLGRVDEDVACYGRSQPGQQHLWDFYRMGWVPNEAATRLAELAEEVRQPELEPGKVRAWDAQDGPCRSCGKEPEHAAAATFGIELDGVTWQLPLCRSCLEWGMAAAASLASLEGIARQLQEVLAVHPLSGAGPRCEHGVSLGYYCTDCWLSA